MKRIMAFILAAVLLLSLAPACFAASDKAVQAADELYELGLFKGKGTDSSGKPIYALDDAPTRQEAVTMLVRLLGKEDEAMAGEWDIPFTDVSGWAKPYVGYAYANGLTNGVSASAFGGGSKVTAAQYITFVLRALGYDSNKDFKWDLSWELSDKLGITSGEYNAGTKQFLRADVAIISASALDATVQPDGVTLRSKVTGSGTQKPDLVVPVKDGTTYSWRFDMRLENNGNSEIVLKQLYICKRNGGESGVLINEYLFEENRLCDIGLGNENGPLRLAPGENFTWNDGHPAVDEFDFMGYKFTFSDASGQKIEIVFSHNLSHELPETVYPSYAGDDGRDLETLRYDADYSIKVADGVYWVPVRSLGKSDYTNAQMQSILTDTPEEKQAEIDTLYEALQLYQIGAFSASDDNIRIGENGIDWEYHKPGYHAVRTNQGCCATDSNWLRYILDGDYDEVGYMAISQRDGSGHIFNYIKMDGWYYFIDLTHYRTDWVATAVESGNLNDYYSSDFVLGNLHRVRSVKDYVNYIQSAFNDPPGLIFLYTAENCLNLDSVRSGSTITITYEKVPGVDVQIVYDDPDDMLEYAFVHPPKTSPDWSAEKSFDFSVIK